MTRRKRTDSTGLEAAASLVRETQARVDETARKRGTAQGLERWHAAVESWHDAMELLYSPSFMDDIERLQDDDPVAIESAIRFLEVDPIAFRTGYLKETIVGRLKKVSLSPDQADRLRAVILRQVDLGYRREFRRYCNLAPRVADESFRAALGDRLRSDETGRATRALWVLEALGSPLTHEDQRAARAIVEAVAASAFRWRASGWLAQAVRRYRDPSWLDDLAAKASVPGAAGAAARHTLAATGMPLTAVQAEQLMRDSDEDVADELLESERDLKAIEERYRQPDEA